MNCDEVELALLTEGERASDAARAPDAVSAHLQACARCRAFLAESGEVLALAALPGPDAAEQLAMSRLAAVTLKAWRRQEQQRAAGGSLLRLALAAGLGAVLASAAVLRLRPAVVVEVPVLQSEAVALEWPQADPMNLSDDEVFDEVSWPTLNEGEPQ